MRVATQNSGEPAVEEEKLSFEEQLSWRADQAKFYLLLGMTLAAPWMFGSTEKWAVWVMNWCGYGAGLLLVTRHVTRLLHPSVFAPRDLPPAGWLTRTLALLTGAILLFTITAALNARARFIQGEQRFEYYDHIRWLPFTYDLDATWHEFWLLLGLACYFWALRDAFLHDRKSPRHGWHPLNPPRRLKTFLWGISLNGAALALVGIFQRLSGTSKVLWLRESWWGTSESLFASFSYRGNACSFLNLVWPVTLGFWWLLRERARNSAAEGARMGGGAHIILLPCIIFMAAAPMISTSRGGTVIAVGALLGAAFILLSQRALEWNTRAVVFSTITSVVLLGGTLGWETLGPRFRDLFTTTYANRNEIYSNAQEMARDYPVYGIGPGAASSLYQLYRSDPGQPWHSFLHDDWLETRVTFGWVGACLIVLALALVFARWFIPSGGIPMPWEFTALLWVAAGGCLLHSKVSFPLQIYSIQQLFLAICAILLSVCRPHKAILVED